MSYRRESIVALMLTAFLWSGCAELQSVGGTNALMSLLSQQLGLTTTQTTGGTGSVLSLAKEKFPSGDFSSLSTLIPGSDSLMQSAKDRRGRDRSGQRQSGIGNGVFSPRNGQRDGAEVLAGHE